MARTAEGIGGYMDLVGNPAGRRLLEGPGGDGIIILKWIFKKNNGGVDWIDLNQDTGKWRAVVNAVMNLHFHSMQGIS